MKLLVPVDSFSLQFSCFLMLVGGCGLPTACFYTFRLHISCMDEGKEKLKFDALLREYSEIRQENRTYEILQIICISISILIFIFMFIASIYSSQYILLFIAPLFSIFFVLLTMGMQAYMTNLGLRASQIEDHLKDIKGVQFPATAFHNY